MEIKKGDVVTLSVDSESSNTFLVDHLYENNAYLSHPLFPECLLKVDIVELNKTMAVLKDSSERSLDFANSNKDLLDFNSKADLESLCLYFVVRRHLTPKQKNILSNICGSIANVKFNGDVQRAMSKIKENEALLDEYNRMWYRNFKGLFMGTQQITSNKQKTSIFNISGFILAELLNPISLK